MHKIASPVSVGRHATTTTRFVRRANFLHYHCRLPHSVRAEVVRPRPQVSDKAAVHYREVGVPTLVPIIVAISVKERVIFSYHKLQNCWLGKHHLLRPEGCRARDEQVLPIAHDGLRFVLQNHRIRRAALPVEHRAMPQTL